MAAPPGNPFDEDVKELAGSSEKTTMNVETPWASVSSVTSRAPVASVSSVTSRIPVQSRSSAVNRIRSPATSATPSTSSFESLDPGGRPAFSVLDGQGGEKASEKACGICGLLLGKRYMRPRHRCQCCGLSVCGSCSMSSLQVDAAGRSQRACADCARQFIDLPDLKERVTNLCTNLAAICDVDAKADAASDDKPKSMGDALATCEEMITTLRELRATSDAARAQSIEANACSKRAELVKDKALADLQATKAELDLERKDRRLAENTAQDGFEAAKRAQDDTLASLREELQAKQGQQEAAETQLKELALALQHSELARKKLEKKLNTISTDRTELLEQHITAAAGTVLPSLDLVGDAAGKDFDNENTAQACHEYSCSVM